LFKVLSDDLAKVLSACQQQTYLVIVLYFAAL